MSHNYSRGAGGSGTGRGDEMFNRPEFISGDLKAVIDAKWEKLIGKRTLSPAYATQEMDGRLVPVVMVTVFDKQRRAVGRALLELRDDAGNVVDTTRTSAGGLGVLRFPPRKPRKPRPANERERVTVIADGDAVTGRVFVIDGSEDPPSEAVNIKPNMQVAKTVFLLDDPFGGVDVQLPPGDDPLTRLPTDFSEDTCNALVGARTNGLLDPNNLTMRDDPLLSPPAGVTTLAGKRLPILRRLAVIRYGPDDRRYLVRLRQEWVLLTYTLGELAQVQALDPGAVVQSAEQFVNQVSTATRETVEMAKSTLSQTLQDVLSSLGSIDSVVKTVAEAGASGWGIGIPGLFGYGSADVDLDLSVSTNINTSLLVNRAIQQAASFVNQAISKAHAIVEGVQRTASDVVNYLAPLVSQVANALHWRVYEVYAVCTNVDAVHLIEEVPLFANPQPFTTEQVLAFRPFFEPALLDKTLVSAYDELLAFAELPPLTEATAEITYNATFTILGIPVPLSPTITMNLAGNSQTASGSSGTTRSVTLRFTFPTPLPRGGTPTATVGITGPSVAGLTSTLQIVRVQVWIDRPLSGPGFILDNPPATFGVPIGGGPGAATILVNHVNANLHYYWGVLATAAIRFPSLRQDVTELQMLDPRLWRLPLVGMEGTTALLLQPETDTIDANELLDDAGAGTLVEILAPGSYGEMLTGLLQLPLDRLHPLLEQVGTFSPFGAFPNLTTGSPTSATSDVLATATSATGGTGLP